jgi:hypothetical protein
MGAGFLLWVLLIISLMIPATASIPVQRTSTKDFFWMKPELQTRLQNHEILVSATEKDQQWSFKGVGRVKSNVEQAYQIAQQYERLREIPNHFRDVSYDAQSRQLSMKIKILWKELPLVVHVVSSEKAPWGLQFQVLNGVFEGVEGSVDFLEKSEHESEIVFLSNSTKKLPFFSSWFLSFTVEAVMSHVASSLRSVIEKEYHAKRQNEGQKNSSIPTGS